MAEEEVEPRSSAAKFAAAKSMFENGANNTDRRAFLKSGMQGAGKKRPDMPMDPTESDKEKRISVNRVKRNSVTIPSGGGLGQSMRGLISSFRGAPGEDGAPKKALRKRKLRLKNVAKKMILVMRLKSKNKRLNIDEGINQIHYIETLEELAEEEIAAIWFTAKEMEDIKWDNEEVAASIDNGLSFEEADGRGLEGKTEEGQWEKYQIRRDGVNCVLDEFDRQYDGGTVEWDIEKFAECYKEHSEPSLKLAREVGQADEDVVKEYIADIRKEIEDKWKAVDNAKLLKANLKKKKEAETEEKKEASE